MTHRDQLPSNRPDERGAVLVYVAVALIGLMAFSALVIDMGVMWVGRRQVQNAADAGALSGAISLAFGNSASCRTAQLEAQAVAQRNLAWGLSPRVEPDLASDTADCTDPSTLVETGDVRIINCPQPVPGLPDKCVRVDAYRNQEGGTGNLPLPTFFARLVGVEEQGARATATAQIIPGTNVTCIKPWAIPDMWYDYHDESAPTTPLPARDSCGVTPPPLGCAPDLDDEYELYPKRPNGQQDPGLGNLNPADYYDQRTDVTDTIYSGYSSLATIGQYVVLKAGDPHGAIQPGWFFPIDLPQPGGPVTGGDRYRENIAECNPTPVAIGDTPPAWDTEPGNMIGPTRQGVDALVAKDPDAWLNCTGAGSSATCTVEDSVCDTLPMPAVCADGRSPRWVPLPVFNPYTYMTERNNGRFALSIVEIIGMWVEGMFQDLDNSVKQQLRDTYPDHHFDNSDVIGRFLRLPTTGGSRNGTSTFLRTVVLVR